MGNRVVDYPMHPSDAAHKVRHVLIEIWRRTEFWVTQSICRVSFGKSGGIQMGQSAWRFCTQCFSMFFDGSPDKGACPAAGGHTAQGFMFVLPHDIPAEQDVMTFDSEPSTCGIPLSRSHLVVQTNGSHTTHGQTHDSGFESPSRRRSVWPDHADRPPQSRRPRWGKSVGTKRNCAKSSSLHPI